MRLGLTCGRNQEANQFFATGCIRGDVERDGDGAADTQVDLHPAATMAFECRQARELREDSSVTFEREFETVRQLFAGTYRAVEHRMPLGFATLKVAFAETAEVFTFIRHCEYSNRLRA